METIFAQATAPGRAGIAVFRVSGPDAMETFALFGAKPGVARQMVLRSLRNGDRVIDEALTVWFPKNQSFTGEPIVELHLHGSPAVAGLVMRTLSGKPSFRPAEAGEFTMRALMANRLDLVQVEALGDLLSAETEAQHAQAMRGFSGEVRVRIDQWRDRLLRAAALTEAMIDFSDEDLPSDFCNEISADLEHLAKDFRDHISKAAAASKVRSGFEVALVGPPNSGKSTLLNRLSGQESALVSEIPGTTRDVLEVRMDVHGHAVTFLDLAGLRLAKDEIEAMGVRNEKIPATCSSN